MARRFQQGSIVTHGNWIVVRYRQDTPEGRKLMFARICPASGPEKLPIGEIRRRGERLIRTAGVNSVEQFHINNGTSFREQSAKFMVDATTRKRKPIKPATAAGWQNILDKWLLPNIGDMPLASVNNGVLKLLVTKMSAAGLSPKSIVSYSQLVKLVVASAVDENGEQLFRRKWNHDFVDMPIVGEQHQPKFSEDEMAKIISTSGSMQMLYILLAASGLRIGEALGLEIKHLSDDYTTLSVQQSVWQGTIQAPKTANAVRVVDIPTSVAALLKAHIGSRTEGLVFASRNGGALMQSNILRRNFHPLLKQRKIKSAGFHTFRRFRTTWLRKNSAPEIFITGALGHAKATVTDGYDKTYFDSTWRKDVTERLGTGFEVPSALIIPTKTKRSVHTSSQKSEAVISMKQ